MKNRTLLKYHSYFGIIAGLFLFVLGVTGSILVFTPDINRWTNEKYIVETNSKENKLDLAIKNVQDSFPDWSTRIISFERGKTIIIDLRQLEEKKYAYIDPDSGTITHVIDANSQFTSWLLKFHYSLHSGIIGKILVLFAGVAFFLSLITGIVLYRKVILKILFFKIKVKNKKKRNYYSALHRYVGVWALLLNLVLVITGLFLSYKVVNSGLQQAIKPTPPPITISVEKALVEIEHKYPDFKPTYIRLPSSDSGAIIINGIFNDDVFYLSEYYNRMTLNSKTGEIMLSTKISESDFTTKLYSSILPLHYGQYGGWIIKILYCLVGLSGPFLSISGYFLWLKRKKKL